MRRATILTLALVCLILLAGCSASATSVVPGMDAEQTTTLPSSPAHTPDTTTQAESLTERMLITIPRLTAELKAMLADPTSVPTGTAVLDVEQHATAMLPTFVADLNHVGDWDRYTLHVTLDPDALTISGSQRVEVTNRTTAPFEELSFHLYPNHPDFGGRLVVHDDVLVDGQPAATSMEQRSVLLRVVLPQPLQPGDTTEVAMTFEAQTKRNNSARTYGAFNQEAGVWALASFYPVLAYRFADGWDHRPVSSQADFSFTDAALYNVTVDVPQEWTLVTTGTEADAEETGAPQTGPPASGMRREHVVSGPQRDFFIAALNNLEQASAVVDGTTITTYYRSDNAEAGQQTLTVAAKSLQAFNETYGRYPFNELEIIQAALTNFLGVEYPGVVLIEQNLYWPGARRLDTTVAHEVAHQWWYNLVGNDIQGQGWIDEGLASYSQIIYYEWQGNMVDAEVELQRFRSEYISARDAGLDGVINRHVDDFDNNYVVLTYAKSALFIHALRTQIGDEAFSRFLQRYYDTYRYNEADGDALISTAEAACACDLQPLYHAWINSTEQVVVP